MLQVTAKHKIYVATEPVDFRCGIDRLVALCRQHFSLNPFSGHLFVFRNKKATMLRVLAYDSQGFWLCQKRLSDGQFDHWPRQSEPILTVSVAQWQLLAAKGDPSSAIGLPTWQSID